MKMPVGPFERPIPRIGDSRLPRLTWTENSCLCFGTMVYASIHMTGWNFQFPTRVEQILWRASSLILLGATVAFWIIESLAMGWRYGGGQELFTRLFTQRSKSRPAELTTSNSNSNSNIANGTTQTSGTVESQQEYSHETPFEPRELPLAWEFWSIFPTAFIYAAARVYILVEALLGLRSLPLSAYLTVDWASLFPHI
ncbi:hypothetical protein K469DRAFT_803522 [Zopfia rhizophila CBS 207.26]|uniref:Uncharacterized protein n=1 Tax=Zopfia rhizophila CBS 207.26 TaxID=1314779 RepID=A0A6A6DGJ0_9PEZI|nr:hypothetical protein K469DRAFT_803522 [Zopfia rhizophila CBS 207.26]